MYSVYKTNLIPGFAETGVIIVCISEQSGLRSAEYHILLHSFRRQCKRLSQPPFTTYIPDDLFGEGGFTAFVLSLAEMKIQAEVYEQYMQDRTPFPPPAVVATATDDSAIRFLRFKGLCEQELNAVARETKCAELRTTLHGLSSFPVIRPS